MARSFSLCSEFALMTLLILRDRPRVDAHLARMTALRPVHAVHVGDPAPRPAAFASSVLPRAHVRLAGVPGSPIQVSESALTIDPRGTLNAESPNSTPSSTIPLLYCQHARGGPGPSR
jgi:hypothetical protein